MALFTLVGDPHCKPDNIDKVNQLFSDVEKLGNPAIVLGDTLHTKEVIRGRCLSAIYDNVKASKLKWIFLVGNHDWYDESYEDYSIRLLATLHNVKIVDRPKQIGKFWAGPYFYTNEEFYKFIQNRPEKCPIVLAHQGITGFDYGNGYIAENEVDIRKLKDVPLVILGHFHKHQVMNNVVYPGTAFSHSFGESNQNKYLGILNDETLGIKWVETTFPKHLTHTIDCDNYTGKIITFDKQNYHRVILTGEPDKIAKFPKNIYPNVKFISKPTIKHSRIKVKETDSTEVKFTKWAVEKGIDKETTTLGVELLRSV